jgi:hypothetical protein
VAKTQQSEDPEGGRIHPCTAHADAWPAEGLSIDAMCKRIAPALWDALVVCKRNVARDLDDLRSFASAPSASRVWPRPAEKHHLAAEKDAQAALAAWFRGYLGQQAEFELWARPGSRIAEWERIPASVIGDLEFDCERATASGEGLPPLYDVHLRRVPPRGRAGAGGIDQSELA